MPAPVPGAAPTSKGKIGSPQVIFANAVAAQTGLDSRVVYAWTVAEGAYAPNGTGGFNFLNLKPYPGDPSSGTSPGGFEQFGSVDQAIAATVRRLNQPFARGIAASAGQTPATQIRAIAASGWDQSHYTGTFDGKSGVGGALYAAFARIYGAARLGGSASTSPLPAAGSGLSGNQTSLTNGLSGALSGLGSGLEGASLRVGLYLIFTIAAFALIFLGLNRAGGGAPSRVLGGLRLGAEAGIPF